MEIKFTYFERSVYSYTFRSFSALRNRDIKRKTLPIKGVSLEEILKEIKKHDEFGRQKVLGIYQSFSAKTRAEKEQYTDDLNSADFIARKFRLFEPIHPELIFIAYDPEPHKDRSPLIKQEKESREMVLVAVKSVLSAPMKNSGVEVSERKEKAPSREKMHEIALSYVKNNDRLERLAVYPINKVPDFYKKDVKLIPHFFEKCINESTSGNDVSTHEKISEITNFLEKAVEIKENYGLTRSERIQLEIIKLNLAELVSELN